VRRPGFDLNSGRRDTGVGHFVTRIRRFFRFAEKPSVISIRRIRTGGDIPEGASLISPISSVHA
jgi:hypothetical protein